MSKKKSLPPKGPKKSQVAKRKQIEKMVEQAEAHVPRQVKSNRGRPHPRKAEHGYRGEDGSNLLSNHMVRVRLAPTPHYAKPALGNTAALEDSEPPVTQSLPSRPFPEIGYGNSRIVYKDARHTSGGWVKVAIPGASGRPAKPSKPFPFLNLPNEIQDLIFEDAIPSDKFHILWAKNHHRTKVLTNVRTADLDTSIPSLILARRLCMESRPNADESGQSSSLHNSAHPTALMWVNRQFYLRASRVFYRKSAFKFSNLNTLKRFLDTVSDSNKEAVRLLKLDHTPYGHPRRTCDRGWKVVYDNSWSILCYRVVTEMPNIKQLKLKLQMHSMPLAFDSLNLNHLCRFKDFSTNWLIPLCIFQDLRLERCYVKILSNVKDASVLEVESWQLRRQLMGERWNESAEAERDAYGSEKFAAEEKSVRKMNQAIRLKLYRDKAMHEEVRNARVRKYYLTGA